MAQAKSKMIILRGQSGAGKTTLATKAFSDYVRCSADDHFMKNGRYVFDRYELQVAHDYYYVKAKKALIEGKNVIIDNTNRKLDEFSRYLRLKEFTSEIVVAKVVSSFTSDKNIPPHVIEIFHREYQRFPGEVEITLEGIMKTRS